MPAPALHFPATPHQLPAPAPSALNLGPWVRIPIMRPQKLMRGNAEGKTESKNTTEDCQVFYWQRQDSDSEQGLWIRPLAQLAAIIMFRNLQVLSSSGVQIASMIPGKGQNL
jgi:hypothetical protein